MASYALQGKWRLKNEMKKIIAVLLVLLFVVSSAYIAEPSFAAVNAADWMSEVPADCMLSALNIPGTHDTGMFNAQFFTGTFCETQSLNITEQLEAGVRIMDIRLRYAGSGVINLCHGAGAGTCDAYDGEWGGFSENLTYDKLLAYLKDFLSKHKGETVILTTQHEWHATEAVDANDNPNKSNFSKTIKKIEEEYGDIILHYDPGYNYQIIASSNTNEKYEVILYIDSEGNASFDSVRKLQDDETVYVINGYDKIGGTVPSTILGEFYTAADNAGLELFPDELIARDVARRCKYTMGEARGKIIIYKFGLGFGDLMDPKYNDYDVCGKDKWNVIRPYLDAAEPQNIKTKSEILKAAYTSCTEQYEYNEDGTKSAHDLFPWPNAEDAADDVNPKILAYNFIKGRHYGWFDMDFVTEALCRKIFESNSYDPDAVYQYYISDIQGFCGDEKNGNKADLEAVVKACRDDGYIPLETNGILNVNPYGYSMVIGYKLSLNPADAITDIKGAYGSNGPSGYTKVKTVNSMYNYFTRGSGSKSEDTYLYYIKDASKKPIIELELLDRCGNVTQKDGSLFNLNEGLGNTIGISFKTAADYVSKNPNPYDEQILNTSASVFNKKASVECIVILTLIMAIAVSIAVAVSKKRKIKE